MEITTTQATQTSTIAAVSAESAAVISSDFETFLQMLTAQAKYQDPLEPIDSSEYAAQLAQFSMVEQQVLSNDLLTALSDQFGSGGLSQMAGLIGMEASTTSPVQFEGSPIEITPSMEDGADAAFLIAYDSTGEEVYRSAIPVDSTSVQWDGVADDGTTLADGIYSFAVESRALGLTTGTTPAEAFTRITEARRAGTETVLILNGGSAVMTDDISALREVV